MEALEESLGRELTVERVRREVKGLSESIQAKQTEIQLIVGSRYHELIESADAVLGMYKSCKHLQHTLTTEVPPALSSLLQGKRPDLHLRPWQEAAAAAVTRQEAQHHQAGAFPLTKQDVHFMLQAPTRLWEAMDAGQYLTAATLWADAKTIADKTEAQGAAVAAAATTAATAAAAAATSASAVPAPAAAGQVSQWTSTQRQVQLAVGQQWACLRDLKGSITAGAHALLRDQEVEDSRQHALALVALSRLEPSVATEGKALLSLFLERREQWLEGMLKEGGKEGGEVVNTAQVKMNLSRAVQALRRTVLDAHRIFVGGGGEGEGGREEGGALVGLRLARLVVAEAVTAWVGRWMVEIHAQARRLLKTLKSSSELASVRQALWQETHLVVAPSFSANTAATIEGEEKEEEGLYLQHHHHHHRQLHQQQQQQQQQQGGGRPTTQAWREACHAVLFLDKLRHTLVRAGLLLTLLPCPPAGKGGKATAAATAAAAAAGATSSSKAAAAAAVVGGGGLDLWGMLFSDSFALLVDDLLQQSMSTIHLAFIQKFDTILSVLHQSPSSSSSSSMEQQRQRYTAVEMAWAAEHLFGYLLQELWQVRRHAHELIQEGDVMAASALGASLQAQALCLLAHLSSYLRTWVQGYEGSSSSSSNSSSSSSEKGNAGAVATAGASSSSSGSPNLDALLIIARFTSLLLIKAPSTILRLSSSPTTTSSSSSAATAAGAAAAAAAAAAQGDTLGTSGSISSSKQGRKAGGGGAAAVIKTIDKVQLESAFTIADARGQGELTPAELQECLDTLGLTQDPSSLPPSSSSSSLSSAATFAEVALLCNAVLEDDSHAHPAAFYLQQAYRHIFTLALGVWAGRVVCPLKEGLREEGIKGLWSVGGEGKEEWRAHRPGWEKKVSVQEDESGRTFEDQMWVPTTISPPVSVLLFSLAAELGRVTQSRDGLRGMFGGGGGEGGKEGGGEGEFGRQRGQSQSQQIPAAARRGSKAGMSSFSSSFLGTSSTTLLESFRLALVGEARRAVEATYALGSSSSTQGKEEGCLQVEKVGEDAVLQAVLDLHFLRHWLGSESGVASAAAPSSSSSSSSSSSTGEGAGGWLGGSLRALVATVDPINYEAFEPFVREAVQAYSQGCALIMSHLCCPPGVSSSSSSSGWGARSTAGSLFLSVSRKASSGSELRDGRGGGSEYSAKALPLVPPVPRFTLLPVVVEASTPTSARLSPPRVGKEGGGLSSFSFSDIMDVGGVGGSSSGGGRARVTAGASAAASVVGSAASNVLSSLFGGGRQ